MVKKRKGVSAREAGFTLIEIVMVLVLLGILAALAVPKYFDLREEADKAAAVTVVEEVQSRVFARFSELLLSGKPCQIALNEVKDLSAIADAVGDGARFGDFYLTPVVLDMDVDGTEISVRYFDKIIENVGKIILPVCGNYISEISFNDETPNLSIMVTSSIKALFVHNEIGVGELNNMSEGDQVNTLKNQGFFDDMISFLPNGGAVTKLSDDSYEILTVGQVDSSVGIVTRINNRGEEVAETRYVYVTQSEGRFVY